MHTAGERVFVDFAGHTMEVIDGATGEVRRAEIFVILCYFVLLSFLLF